MTKAQHDPHDLAQWLLSRDGDLANLAGRELKRALDRAEKAEAALKANPDRSVYLANHRQAHCIQFTAAALGPEYAATIDGLPKAARHMRERAEKAEAALAIDDSCMDTAHVTGYRKGWNEAIEAALLIAGGFAGVDCNPEMVEAISIIKKGGEQ